MRIIILFILLSYWGYAQHNPITDDSAQVVISRVIDGDTYEFQYKNDFYRIRLLNFDCYETRYGKRLNNQAAKNRIKPQTALQRGQLQKRIAERILLNQKVIIIRDDVQPNFDVYGRLLRHIKLDNINLIDSLRKVR